MFPSAFDTTRVAALAAGFTLAAGLGIVGAGRAQAAEPRTIADCEAIQAADAYNQCLAKFGPTSKLHNLEPERPSDVKDNGAEAAASSGPAKYKGHATKSHRRSGHHHGGGGRKHAQFTVSHHGSK